MDAFESVSTWRQPMPPVTSASRSELMTRLAADIVARSGRRIRVGVDGRTAAGKTTFAHELAAAVRACGRPTLRASLDDFKHPWSHASEHGYDRVSGEGYYRNAHDHTSVRRLLLEPAGGREGRARRPNVRLVRDGPHGRRGPVGARGRYPAGRVAMIRHVWKQEG